MRRNGGDAEDSAWLSPGQGRLTPAGKGTFRRRRPPAQSRTAHACDRYDPVVKTGLTLGKHAPLHHGHQFVISTALREMDHVIVLIYPAAETRIPLSVRANWIRTLYPS